MAIVKATIKAAIVSLLQQPFDETTSAEDLRNQFADKLADVIEAAIKSATVTVPGTGLVAPSGGGPVTGSSITGLLS